MSSLPALQLVECVATDFTSLDGRLAKGGQVLPGAHVVVDTETDLGTAVAHEAESPDPVGNQEARGVVGGCLARGGTEADGGEKGTGEVLASSFRPIEIDLRHGYFGIVMRSEVERKGLITACGRARARDRGMRSWPPIGPTSHFLVAQLVASALHSKARPS